MNGYLSGPGAVTVSATSRRGLLAGHHLLGLSPSRFSLLNTGSGPLTLRQVQLDPLREADSGAEVPADLAVDWLPAREEPPTLAPGDSVSVVIGGRVPARANRYESILRVQSDAGEILVIPVTVKIAASPAWGIACMLFGLCLVGVINALNAESGAQNKLRDILRFRQEIHELLEQSPAPESAAQDQMALDEDLSVAIKALHRRRSLSIVDRRIGEADERFDSAKKLADRLRDVLGGRRVGQGEVESLREEWMSLQSRIQDLNKRTATLFARPAPAGLATHLENFFRHFQNSYLVEPMGLVTRELANEMDRVDLVYGSGSGEQARAKAIVIRRWMRRASREMDDRVALILATGNRGRTLAFDDSWIRQETLAEGLPVAAKTKIQVLLDRAAARLGETSIQADFAAASALVEQALTELTRAESQAMKARVDASLAAIDDDLDIKDVTRVIGEVTALPDRSPPAKIAGMTRIMDAWRTRVRSVPDDAARRSLIGRVDAAMEHLRRGDLEAVIPENHAIRDEWSAYVAGRVRDTAHAVIAPLCDRWRLDLRRRLDGLEQDLKLVGPRLELRAWEKTLDELRFEQLNLTSDDCLGRVVDLGQREGVLANAIFAASLGDATIPADMRLKAAQDSGVLEAIALSRRLLTQPRDLTVQVTTGMAERYVGRANTFSIENLDRSWQQGIQIRVDFGDRSLPLTLDAEQLGHNPQVQHTFANGGRHNINVRVAEAFGPGGDILRGSVLGEGLLTLSIDDSPVSKAQQVADQFLNLRFLLTLLIAAIVYYWRFHAKDRVFGMQGFDYVQAFVLGFVVEAAATDLPHKLEQFLGG
jgi:hypothetical protein